MTSSTTSFLFPAFRIPKFRFTIVPVSRVVTRPRENLMRLIPLSFDWDQTAYPGNDNRAKTFMMAASKPARDTTTSFTLRKPPYSYLHLTLQSLQSNPPQTLDEITARSYLTAALQQYLGLTGAAIPIDILKVEGRSVWIRVPRDDEVAVTSAVSQWVSTKGVSLRIEARGSWLGGVVALGRRDEKLWSLEA